MLQPNSSHLIASTSPAPSPTVEPTCSMQSLARLLQSESLVVAAVPVALWAGAVVAGTALPKSPLGILSLKTSLKELSTGRASRLNILDTLRVLAILWVMMNHTGSEGRIDILERLPSADAFKSAVHNHPIFGALLGNSALGVEVFLVLSGLLAARSWLRSADTPFKEHYFKYVSRRVFRLFPSVALFVYIAAGPIMKALLPRFHTTMISACGASGIAAHLGFLGNWQEFPTCLGYLWYLGLDMQLHIVAPFFLHALTRHGRVAVVMTLATVLLSSGIRAAYCMIYGTCNKSDVDIPFISFPDADPIAIKSMYLGLWEMYARPYTKCGPFLLGLLFGWASASWEKQGYRISKRMAFSMFFGGFALAIATIYAILPEYWYPDMSANFYNVTYTSLFRSVFAMAVILMIAALTLADNIVGVSLIWSILARLTFSAYLLHMPVVYILNFLPYLQEAEDAMALVVVLPGVAFLSFAVAAPFYLLVESPIGRLVTSWDANQKVASHKRATLMETTPKSSFEAAPGIDHNQNLPLLIGSSGKKGSIDLSC